MTAELLTDADLEHVRRVFPHDNHPVASLLRAYESLAKQVETLTVERDRAALANLQTHTDWGVAHNAKLEAQAEVARLREKLIAANVAANRAADERDAERAAHEQTKAELQKRISAHHASPMPLNCPTASPRARTTKAGQKARRSPSRKGGAMSDCSRRAKGEKT